MNTLSSLFQKSVYINCYSKGTVLNRHPVSTGIWTEVSFFSVVFFFVSEVLKFSVPISPVFLSLLLCPFFFFLFLLRMLFGGEHMLVSYSVFKTKKREWGIDGRRGGQGKDAAAHFQFPETNLEFSGIFLACIIKIGHLFKRLRLYFTLLPTGEC